MIDAIVRELDPHNQDQRVTDLVRKGVNLFLQEVRSLKLRIGKGGAAQAFERVKTLRRHADVVEKHGFTILAKNLRDEANKIEWAVYLP